MKKENKMKADQAKEEIRYIKEMIDRTRATTADSGIYLILWGVLTILAITTMYILVHFERFEWIWLNWILFMVVGAIFTIIHKTKNQHKQRVKTYAYIAVEHLWIACGIGFILLGFVFPLARLYSFGVIPVAMAVIAGIGVFVSGGIYAWSLLKWCGILWWAGGIGLLFVHANYRGILMIPLLILGYLVPGIIFNIKYRKNGKNNDS